MLGFLEPRLPAASVVDGPSVETTSGASAVIRWRTDVATAGRVRFGTNASRLDREASGKVDLSHEVQLEGLTPGARYTFTIGTARRELATNEFTVPGVAPRPPPPGKDAPRPHSGESKAPPARQTWANGATLQDHFNRHGADFDARDPEDYARQAWEFRERARSSGLPAKVDTDGVIRIFDPRTGAFAAYAPSGKTKTYFKPGSRDYFERQPGRTVRANTLHF
jgi:hypothetical protein